MSTSLGWLSRADFKWNICFSFEFNWSNDDIETNSSASDDNNNIVFFIKTVDNLANLN